MNFLKILNFSAVFLIRDVWTIGKSLEVGFNLILIFRISKRYVKKLNVQKFF